MTKTLPALAAAIVAGALVVPTVSQAETTASVAVSYADLNLKAATGRQSLERRIAYAARSVCAVGRSQELVQIAASGDCHDEALALAQPAFDAAIRAALNPSVTVQGAAAIIVTAQ